jgi:uridine kinase
VYNRAIKPLERRIEFIKEEFFMKKMTIKELLKTLKNINRSHETLIVGIDGCGGSGKSTLARILENNDNSITVVEMDDFYKPSNLRSQTNNTSIGEDFDWKRVEKQVILPLIQNKVARYQKYDWNNDTLTEWCSVPTGGIVIIEGVYSTRKELSKYYDFKIWVDSPREIRLQRGIERDGIEARYIWERDWMPKEDRYVKEHKPYEVANLIVDGSGTSVNIEKNEIYVVSDTTKYN